RLLAPSQGPHRARLAHLSGPLGQRTPPRPRLHFVRSQRRARPLLRRLQPALRSRRRRRLRLPLPAAPLRSRPLPQLALSARRRPRSLHLSRRAFHRPAALARPARLRRRNRRTLPSTRRHAVHLSRRYLAARFAFAARRTRRTTPCAHHHRAETENPDAPHL